MTTKKESGGGVGQWPNGRTKRSCSSSSSVCILARLSDDDGGRNSEEEEISREEISREGGIANHGFHNCIGNFSSIQAADVNTN